MFTPSLPADHFLAPKALFCPQNMAILRSKMTHQQMRYHGNETTALRKLLFITIYYSNIDKKTLGAEKQKSKEVKSNKKLCPIFCEKVRFFLYGTTLSDLI